MNISSCALRSSWSFRVGLRLFIIAALFVLGGFSPQVLYADDAVLGVNQIEGVANSKGAVGVGTADNTFENGWKWVFNVTVPDSESFVKMKFLDWSDDKKTKTILAGGNIRFYSPQSSNIFDAEHAITLDGANAYGETAMTLIPSSNGDLDSFLKGKQIQIIVQARIPEDALKGSYSTNYGITSLGDVTPPVLTLIGSSVVTIQAGSPYNDAGATAVDDVDGNISSSIVRTGLNINTSIIKINTVTYNVMDSNGNSATPITRTVKVVANTSALSSGITSAQALHDGAVEGVAAGQYAVGSKATLQTAINTATTVKTSALNAAESQAQVDAAVSALSDAATAFTNGKVAGGIVPATSVLSSAIASAQTLHDGAQEGSAVGEYAVGSKATLQTAITTATAVKTAALAAGATQAQVNAAVSTLGSAVTTFNDGKVTSGGDTLDVSALTTSIASAQKSLDGAVEGVEVGQYAVDSTKTLQTAIDDATTVQTAALEGSATQTQVDAAVSALNEAISVFLKGKVTDGKADETAPVITLLGIATVTVQIDSSYTDAGATASDDTDGDITSSIVRTGAVNTSVTGTYTLTYTVMDASGNSAEPVTRTVRVVSDGVTPVITILGKTTMTLQVGAPSYTDAGATASDDTDGDITASIVSVGSVNTAVVGVYTITYTVVDASGNSASAVRTVTIAVPTPPVLTLIGSSVVTIQAGSPYNDAGATAVDDVDGNISSSIVRTGLNINTSIIKINTVTYNVMDSNGNSATPITRTVKVVANTSALSSGITSAQALHDGAVEGVAAGQYAVGSKATLQTAINTATTVKTSALNAAESQAQVDAAVSALSDAATAFTNGKVADGGGVGGEI